MEKIIISIGRKNLPINNFFIELSKELIKNNIKPILIVNGKVDYINDKLKMHSQIMVLQWPSISPSYIRDIIFLSKIILKQNPNWIIANMRFQNIILLTSFILSVPSVIAWVHTSFNNKEEYSKRFDWLNRRLKSSLFKTANKIIPVSRFLRKILRDKYSLNNKNIIPINNALKDPLQ